MSPETLTLVSHQTATQMPQPAPVKRVAIIGTAESWKCCPWQDQTLEVWGLNDAYLIGVPRATRWYDLHPTYQMHFRPADKRVVPASEVPLGAYIRPEGHLESLRTRPMPIFVNQARPDWPTSQTFPIDAVLNFFKPFWPYRLTRKGVIEPGPDYEVSTPSWMLMHAIVEGYTEIHVYGIHLATQWEYVQQRPNFEWLLGFASGRGIKIVLPASTPICRAAYRYGFEPKADLPMQQAEMDITTIKTQGASLKQQYAALPWYARQKRADLLAQIQRTDVALADARQAQTRVSIALTHR